MPCDADEVVRAEPAAGQCAAGSRQRPLFPAGGNAEGSAKGQRTVRSVQHPTQKAPLVADGGSAVGSAKGNGTARSQQHPSKKPPLVAADGSAMGSARGQCAARNLQHPSKQRLVAAGGGLHPPSRKAPPPFRLYVIYQMAKHRELQWCRALRRRCGVL